MIFYFKTKCKSVYDKKSNSSFILKEKLIKVVDLLEFNTKNKN